MNKKMTRKEQIKQAAREYTTHLTDTGEMDYYGHFEKEIKFNNDNYSLLGRNGQIIPQSVTDIRRMELCNN